MAKRRINQMKRLPLSKKARAIGVRWLMADGVRTAEEARGIEKAFLRDLKKIQKMQK